MNKLIQLGRNLLGLDDDVQALSAEQERDAARKKVRWRIGTGAAIVVGLGAVGVAVVANTLAGAGHHTEVPKDILPSSSSVAGGASGRSMLVHVTGAVRSPGVYTLEKGSRVVDALMLAGGWATDAQLCGINMARELADGEQLSILQGDSATCEADGGASTDPISLNRATAAQLDALPGVGATLATRIIDWRKAHGGFTRLEQLNEVSGISDKLFASLKPLVSL